MKNLIFTILFITGAMIQIHYHAQTNRQIYWVHGLKGNAAGFNTISQYFNTQRYLTSYNPQYSTDGGIQGSANELQTKITANNANAICVAQSMGGVNVRQFYKDRYTQTGQKPYGGLITTGTPHLGSRAADNLDNGQLISFCNSAYSNITKGICNDPLNYIAGFVTGWIFQSY